MTETHVAVIGSQPGLSDSICEELAMFGDLRVVAADSYLGNIHEFLSKQHPDVIVLEAEEARAEEWLALVQIHISSPSPAVVLLSNHDNREQINVAVQRGASAIVLKVPPAAELADAIRHAVRGEMWLSPPLLTQVLAADCHQVEPHLTLNDGDVRGDTLDSEPDASWGQDLNVLSSRELAVLELLTEGMGHLEIAARLGLSPFGVSWHLQRIRLKLRVQSSHLTTSDESETGAPDPNIRQLFAGHPAPGQGVQGH
jgi:DNA-binding NarL/FixJ family response regulator